LGVLAVAVPVGQKGLVPVSRGISSIVSVLRIRPESYPTLFAPIKKVNGRMVLLADHIKISKEGRRMACVQKWHQESQNPGKPEYIKGHNFGVASIVANREGG
jgi:hypothetical protein